jgi:hypothetical protein
VQANDGRTPLAIADFCGSKDVAELLRTTR